MRDMVLPAALPEELASGLARDMSLLSASVDRSGIGCEPDARKDAVDVISSLVSPVLRMAWLLVYFVAE